MGKPKIAVFLGAGASKAFGYPLTAEILPAIKKHLSTRELFGPKERERRKAEELDSYFAKLLPGWKNTNLHLPPITDILSLIDHSLLSDTSLISGLGPAELTRFRKLVERAIYEVINDAYRGDAWPILERFLEWLLRDPKRTGMITTNYDIEVDKAVFSRFQKKRSIEERIDFAFGWREPKGGCLYHRPQGPLFRLYKLRGSLNWLRCDVCEHTYINLYGPIAHQAFRGKPHDANTCDCGHHILSLVLVAPSIDSQQRYSFYLEYSFPPEDLAIR